MTNPIVIMINDNPTIGIAISAYPGASESLKVHCQASGSMAINPLTKPARNGQPRKPIQIKATKYNHVMVQKTINGCDPRNMGLPIWFGLRWSPLCRTDCSPFSDGVEAPSNIININLIVGPRPTVSLWAKLDQTRISDRFHPRCNALGKCHK